MDELTPAAHWRNKGKADPHGDRFNCQRHELPHGAMTDDELANEVFLKNHDISILQAGKDRIRWLSRKTELLQSDVNELIAYNNELCAYLLRASKVLALASHPLPSPYEADIQSLLSKNKAESLTQAIVAAIEGLQPNGEMKAEMIGESFFFEEISCQMCSDVEDDDDCECCDGSGSYSERRIVPWHLQKDIWMQMNAIAARQLRERESPKTDGE